MTATQDALDLLQAEHRELKGLFDSFGQLCRRDASASEKAAVAQAICVYLGIHVQVEEELFFPAMRSAVGAAALEDRIRAERLAKELMAQISAMQPADPLYDARVAVLGSTIAHHAMHEERELFPMARQSRVDLLALGARMQARKSVLLARFTELASAGRFDEARAPVGCAMPSPPGTAGTIPIGASA